jgi:predicted GTPase
VTETTLTQSVGGRAEFLVAMRELRADFESAKGDITERESILRQALHSVTMALEEGMGNTVLRDNHPLAQSVKVVNEGIIALVKAWLKHMWNYDRNTSFREGFDNTLMVYVLGKVKAGKSSLGNYVAYGRSVPNLESYTGPVPTFFKAAVAEDSATGHETSLQDSPFFAVGANETTNSIQGFRLDGLTWVDSPGLHSVTPENGVLASAYSDSADLIIYPMQSGSPGRDTDADEIRKLVRDSKHFLVVITRSDKLVEDEEPPGE